MSAQSLRGVKLLAGLSDERLETLAQRGAEVRLAPGDVLFEEGSPPDRFFFLLAGELETRKLIGGDEVVIARHEPGGYLGAIAVLTDTPFRAGTWAVVESRVFVLEPDAFLQLVLEEAGIRKTVMRVFDPMAQSIQGAARDREKLLALGRLAAGLAHELNNPAAAARRAIAELREARRDRDEALADILACGLGAEGLGLVCGYAAEAAARAASAPRLDPLDRLDREGELAHRLAERGVGEAAEVAASFVEAGLDEAWVDGLAEAVAPAGLSAGLRLARATLTTEALLAELDEATARILQLVGATKQYSYMDQAPRQEVDVNQGLESTLAILAHKLNGSEIQVVREYDESLPRIDAYGSELNQVWTNLIDNAVGALGGRGRIVLRTSRRDDRVVVEIADDGPGIPEEIRSRIFEPFFTTKPVGSGTGLGLDIAQRIVMRHHGELRVESKPGDTRFEVVLPITGSGG